MDAAAMQSSTKNRNSSSITEQIISDIASKEGCKITDLPPLYNSVSPEALESLVESGAIKIEFRHCGHEVAIEEGEVSIE